MAKDREPAPFSPTALGIRFGLPIAGLGEGGAEPGESLLASNAGSPFEAGFQSGSPPSGLPLDDGMQAVPGQSGAEALADLPRSRPDDPFDGP